MEYYILMESEVLMFLFISMNIFIFQILLWILLIQSKKSMSDEEKFIEDNLQMQYLKEIKIKNGNKM